jgi:hypothetical protein
MTAKTSAKRYQAEPTIAAGPRQAQRGLQWFDCFGADNAANIKAEAPGSNRRMRIVGKLSALER